MGCGRALPRLDCVAHSLDPTDAGERTSRLLSLARLGTRGAQNPSRRTRVAEPESQNPSRRTRVSRAPSGNALTLRCNGRRKAGSARVRFMAPRRVQGRSAPPTPSQESATGQTVLPVTRTSRPGLLENTGATSRKMTPVEWIPHFAVNAIVTGEYPAAAGLRQSDGLRYGVPMPSSAARLVCVGWSGVLSNQSHGVAQLVSEVSCCLGPRSI